MKPVILAEKPSQAKAYADAFSVKRHEGYLEILPSPILPERYEFQVVKKLIKGTLTVINGFDFDISP